MRDDRDDVIERIVDELKTLPPVPANATARVLARVEAARRERGVVTDAGDDDDVIYFPAATDEIPVPAVGLERAVSAGAATHGGRAHQGFRRRFVISLPAAIGYALAATLAGFLIRGALPRSGSADAPVQTVNAPRDDTLGAASGMAVTPVSMSKRDLQETPVTVQFVLDANRASRVAVVGDFNGWHAGLNPLTRDSASGLWTALVQVRPGRHVYGFLVDGKLTLDPQAPRATDPDYGTEQSVMIVGVQ